MQIRFLHTGDFQLGVRRRFLDDGERYAAARLEAVEALGRLAREEGCAFVVVCGDVFESNQLDRRTVARALEAMRAGEVPFYLLPGNHDPLDAASVYRSEAFRRERPDNVRVLEGGEPVEAAPGVELAGAPWPSKRPVDDLVGRALERLDPAAGVLRVLAGHGVVDAGAPDPDDPALVRLARVEAALAEGRVHYVALGDRHSVTRVGETGRVWYAGTPEPTAFDEEDPGSVLLVDLAPGECRVEARRVGVWRFLRRELDLAGAEDVERLAAWLDELPDKRTTALRLGLVGQLPLRQDARLQEVLDRARDLFAAVDLWEGHTHLVPVPDRLDRDELGLSGFAGRTLERLLAAAREEEEAAAAPARDALALLYRLARSPA